MGADAIFNRFLDLSGRMRWATTDIRLDLADEAERLAFAARDYLEVEPVGPAHPIVASICERACDFANSARARA